MPARFIFDFEQNEMTQRNKRKDWCDLIKQAAINTNAVIAMKPSIEKQSPEVL